MTRHQRQPDQTADDVRAALDAVRRIVQALRAGADTGRLPGLTTAQVFALQQIAVHPGASINEIAALTFTHQSSVSVVVQRLVDRELVVRSAATGDRRRQALQITAAGRRALKRAPAAVQERLIVAIAALPADERRQFAASLVQVARVMMPEGARTPHPPMLFEDSPRARAARPRKRQRRG